MVDFVEAGAHLVNVAESAAHLVNHRRGVADGDVLRKVADSGVTRHGDIARCRLLYAGDDFEHRRFSGTVFADKRNLVLGIYYI